MTKYWLGKTRSKETRDKISAALSGKKRSPHSIATKAKISLAKKGKALGKMPKKARENISLALLNHWSKIPKKLKPKCEICDKQLVSWTAKRCKVHATMIYFEKRKCPKCSGSMSRSSKVKVCKTCHWNAKRLEVVCDFCSKQFFRAISSQVKKRINTFCSPECRNSHWKYIRKPEEHPLYRGIGDSNAKLYRERGKVNNPNYYENKKVNSVIYRIRRRGLGGSITRKEWEEIKSKKDFSCLSCGKREPEIKLVADHIIPVVRWEEWIKNNKVNYSCGDKENIQPLCISCNCRKSWKLPNETRLPITKLNTLL